MAQKPKGSTVTISNEKQLKSDSACAEALNYIKNHSLDCFNYTQSRLERLIFTSEYIEKSFSKTDIILDIGSFPYFLPTYLSLRGFDNITTIEIPGPQDLDFPLDPPWNYRTMRFDIEESKFPLEDNSVDLVLLLEVFEHLYKRPNQVFREIKRILKPGGRLIISTPNGARLIKLVLVLLKKKFGGAIFEWSSTYEKLGHFGHIREYSIQEIEEYIAHFDLVAEKVAYRSFEEDPGVNAAASPWPRYFSSIMKNILGIFPIFQNTIFITARVAK